MLAAAARWLAVLAPAPAPRAAEIVEDPDIRPPTIVWEPPEPAAAPPAPVWGSGDLFETVGPDGGPADPSALAPRVRLTDAARDRLGLSEEQAAAVSAAATAARAAWAREFVQDVRVVEDIPGSVLFDLPDALRDSVNAGREAAFFEAADPKLDRDQERLLREGFFIRFDDVLTPPFSDDYSMVRVARRGEWFAVSSLKANPYARFERRPPSPEFPAEFVLLKPAVDRLARGEPAFPPVAEVAPPDAETAEFPEPDPAR